MPSFTPQVSYDFSAGDLLHGAEVNRRVVELLRQDGIFEIVQDEH